jgi:guanylate kinase
VLLDDGAHNIFSTPAKYPVLMRRPWNQNITGALAVNNYDEFLSLVKQIKERYVEKPFDKNKPGVIALVGPSGTGKTTIAEKAIELYPELFAKPKSYTTRMIRANETSDAYNFTTKEEFCRLKDIGEIFESTIYSGNYYGSSKQEVAKVLQSGKNVIIPLDMCGAIGMKTTFDNATIVFVDRHKRDILTALLSRNSSVEDKMFSSRIFVGTEITYALELEMIHWFGVCQEILYITVFANLQRIWILHLLHSIYSAQSLFFCKTCQFVAWIFHTPKTVV